MIHPASKPRIVGLVVVFFGLGLAFSAAPARAESSEKKKAEPAPALRYEQFRRSIELQVEEKREAQIQGILKLLDLGPDPAELPDLKFRLAELYFEKSRFYFFRSQQAAETAIGTDDPGQRERAKQTEQEFLREQRRWIDESLSLYREVQLTHPDYVRMPEILFAMGQVYWNTGRPQESIDTYAELIRNHPDSPLVSEAWLAFGEFYFDQGDVDRALRSYEKAAQDKRSRVYGFALYKQGWCYYNLSRWREALRKFRATVLYSQLASELSGENKIALGREAQKDYVRTYQHVGNAEEAPRVFADLLGVDSCTTDRCKVLLENLANLWMESGYFGEAASLFRRLIRLEPGAEKNPVRQSKVMDLVSRTGSKKQVVAEAKKLVQMVRELPEDSEAWESGKLVAENNLRRLAQIWNKEGRKTRSDPTLRRALELYEDYLELFPDADLAYEMRFQLADLYFELERFDEAASAYEATVAADPDGKHLASAANDAILAIEEHLRDLQLPEAEPDAGTEPAEIHPQRLRLVRACDEYVEKVASDDSAKRQAVRFKAAKVFYDANHFDEALRRFGQIVDEAPSAEQAEFAANLVLDVHNLREDWQALYETAMKYRSEAALLDGRPRLAADLDKFAQAAKFKLVQALAEDGDSDAADAAAVARGYQEFYEEFPSSPDADKALFNASVAWDRAGAKRRATEMRQRLLDEYPDSKLRIDVAHYQAKQFEERTQYAEAARALASFARNYPRDERARDALYNAAVFHAGMGHAEVAARLRLEYLKKYGRSEGGVREAADIYWRMAVDLEQAGNPRLAAARYGEFARRFPDDGRVWDAMRRQAGLLRGMRRVRSARRIEGRFRRRYARLGERSKPEPARRWMAELELQSLEAELSRYERIRIRPLSVRNPTPFKRSVGAKARARDALIEKLARVVTEYREASTSVAALYRIAQTWDGFVDALTSVPCPRGLSEDACFMVKDGIETQAAPAREAALEAFQTCVDKSIELQMYTEDSRRCVAALEARGVLPQLTELLPPVAQRPRFEPPDPRGPLLELPAGADEMEPLASEVTP